jgi:hypothetical protein
MLTLTILNLRLSTLFSLAGLILIIGAFQFAAASSLTAPQGGIGSNTISGYEVSDVAYHINEDGDPTTLDKVSLNLSAADSALSPTHVQVKVISASNFWFDCAPVFGSRWSCQIAGATVKIADLDELSVVAS